MKYNAFIAIIVFLIVGIFVSARAQAIDFIIEGNGSNSDSEVWYENTTTTNVNQTNNGSVNNNVDANANTGGNSASGNNGASSITTGDANVNVNITNHLNSNNAEITGCCTTPTSTPKPGQPTPTQKPGSPTPTPDPGGNNGGGSNNGGTGGANVGGSGSVLGLAATSGEPLTEYLLYGASAICLVVAKKLLTAKTLVN